MVNLWPPTRPEERFLKSLQRTSIPPLKDGSESSGPASHCRSRNLSSACFAETFPSCSHLNVFQDETTSAHTCRALLSPPKQTASTAVQTACHLHTRSDSTEAAKPIRAVGFRPDEEN